MKLPCYLVRDLLPLYKDGVCDPQTAADLKEHLAGCESCRAALAALAAEPAARASGGRKAAGRRRCAAPAAPPAGGAVDRHRAGGRSADPGAAARYRGWVGGQIRDIPADAIEEVVLREDGSLHAWLEGGLAYTTMSGVRAEVGGREAVFFTVGVSVWDSQVRALENLRNGLLKDRWYGASDLTILQGSAGYRGSLLLPHLPQRRTRHPIARKQPEPIRRPDYASLLWTDDAT